MNKKTLGVVLGIVLIGIIAITFSEVLAPKSSTPSTQSTNAPTQIQSDTFSHNGKDGQDALTLLKEKTKVEQDNSGLVTAINGRKADNTKKEFWAFSVNGEMAQVGPKEFMTKDADTIEWKIDTY